MTESLSLPEVGQRIADHLDTHFDPSEARVRQVLALAEETGEFVGAFRRAEGMARRTGPWADVQAELADVVITAYVTAQVLGIDLDTAVTAKTGVIFTRGWREQTP